MIKSLLPALLLVLALPSAAEPSKDDADLASQFLGCGNYFTLLPSLSGKDAQGEHLVHVKELENFSRLAALALVGKDGAKLASTTARNDFSESLRQADAKGGEAVLAFLQSWSDRCSRLMDDKAAAIAPRIEAYVAADTAAREKPGASSR